MNAHTKRHLYYDVMFPWLGYALGWVFIQCYIGEEDTPILMLMLIVPIAICVIRALLDNPLLDEARLGTHWIRRTLAKILFSLGLVVLMIFGVFTTGLSMSDVSTDYLIKKWGFVIFLQAVYLMLVLAADRVGERSRKTAQLMQA
ncbi:hypothetical protein HED60_12465 [Planctomycetales bacterium ZRK34]|nr:hypothetical protein HED60_12465 [Planctomycetales bacterium ZRK34]